MKAKFLIPEINYEKFAKDFSHQMEICKLKLKDFEQISAEENSTSLISQYKLGKKFSTINRFLAICRFFMDSPDSLLSPKPKWIACEIDDISKFNVLGKFNDVYYITPSYDHSSEKIKQFQYFQKNLPQKNIQIFIYMELATKTLKLIIKAKLFTDFLA